MPEYPSYIARKLAAKDKAAKRPAEPAAPPSPKPAAPKPAAPTWPVMPREPVAPKSTAVDEMKRAFHLHPDELTITDQMKRAAELHPEYIWAKIMVDGVKYIEHLQDELKKAKARK